MPKNEVYERLKKDAEVLAMSVYHYPPQDGQGLKLAAAMIHRSLIEAYYDGVKAGITELGKAYNWKP